MAFLRALHLNKQRVFAVGPEDSTYIFDMAGNSDESTLAVSASNHAIKLYDTATLTLTSQLLGTEVLALCDRCPPSSAFTLFQIVFVSCH